MTTPLQIEHRPTNSLTAYSRNARTHDAEQIAKIAASIVEFGFTNPVLISEQGEIIAGHGRVLAAQTLGIESVPVIVLGHLTEDQRRAYVIADNAIALGSGWDEDLLRSEIEALAAVDFGLDVIGFDEAELSALLNPPSESQADQGVAGSLAERFGVPPFSVLNAREGWWQDRKRAWLARGIQSELGRGEAPGSTLMPVGDLPTKATVENIQGARAGRKADAKSYASQDSLNAIMGKPKTLGAIPDNLGKARQSASLKGGLTFGTTTDPSRKDQAGAEALATGTSIFDPVLCELSYRWFCPPGGLVLDPFAGGSVRGLVAAWLGLPYIGGDLSARQLDANREQAAELLTDEPAPIWVQGDSRALVANLAAAGHEPAADMVFTCPPYADLEVYSDDPADLSNMPYEQFVAAYREALAQAASLLKPDRFAVVVVGEVRDPKGHYRNFVGDTVEAMRAAGLAFYNEAILVTAVGSLPVRAGKQFTAARKLGKTHQNVLVFVKGDARRATKACGEPEFGEMVGDDA